MTSEILIQKNSSVAAANGGDLTEKGDKMAVELRMPKMGLTMSTAQVVKWLKNEGDQVSVGEAVVEVMTDKLTNKVEAPQAGVILKIVAQPGSDLEAGAILAYIGQPGEAISEVAGSKAEASSPAAKSGAEPSTAQIPSSPPPSKTG
ncbi:MAG: hypothetical protein LBT62_02715, partial [Deltaproteobacteria bacterium]|nr:hypothetical protein [Deltaproteobacteria bacterium]